MKEFLNLSMKKNQTGDTKAVREFSEKFIAACQLIVDELGEKPFHVRTRLSSSTLDAVMVISYAKFEQSSRRFCKKV